MISICKNRHQHQPPEYLCNKKGYWALLDLLFTAFHAFIAMTFLSSLWTKLWKSNRNRTYRIQNTKSLNMKKEIIIELCHHYLTELGQVIRFCCLRENVERTNQLKFQFITISNESDHFECLDNCLPQWIEYLTSIHICP